MSHVYLATMANGSLAIISVIPGGDTGAKLTKTLFELSRDKTAPNEHFDPAVHTREAIASGLPNHTALALAGECESTDLPTDRYFRNAWEWSD